MMTVFQRTLRLVTFDVTHTLLRFKISPGKQYAEVAKRSGGVAVDVEDVSNKFKVNYKDMCKKYSNFGRGSEVLNWEEWWRTIVRNTFSDYIKDVNVMEHVASQLIESYKLKEYWMLNDGCIDILEYLKDNGVTIGVISNFDPRLKEILRNVGIINYFDFVLSSYEAGFAKPDNEIFLKALLIPREKIMPKQALHIGDSLELDYLAARSSGWQSAIISNNNRDKYNDINAPINKCHIFNDLNELKDCLLEHNDLFKH